MEYARFTLWDFLVGIVPGASVLLLTVSLLPRYFIEILEAFPISTQPLDILVVIVIGYLLGSFVQAISSKADDLLHKGLEHDSRLDRWLYENIPEHSKVHHWRHEGLVNFADPFIENMISARRDIKEENKTIRRRFLEESQVFFSTQDAEDYSELRSRGERWDDYKLRELTYSYLLNSDIGQVQRFHILYVLMRGMYLVLGIGAILHASIFLSDLLGIYNSFWSPIEAGSIILFLAFGTVISYAQRRKFHQRMARSMISDLYSSELRGQ